MKEHLEKAVERAVELWASGSKNFETAALFLKSRANDPCVSIGICRQTLNYFRSTRDLEKTKRAFFAMRKAKYMNTENKKIVRTIKNLTIHDGVGTIKKGS